MPGTVSFHTDLLDSHCIVDVRTPLEYAEDHLPGAVNVPILTNEERVEVGTLYKQVGPQPARQRGLELACGRFGAMVAEIAAHAGGRPVLVYCWRGGLRSRSMAILLEMSGYPVVRLLGGYKAFRAVVTGYFDRFSPPAPMIVLHGMTGIGKTDLINRLDPAVWSTIDLEGLACHRGSAFGQLGLGGQPEQKRFDTLLWDAFRRLPSGRPIVLEGESQRIGRLSLPGNLYQVMSESRKVWCHASIATRVNRLAAEYARREYFDDMAAALERIRKKLGGERYAELRGYLEAWEMERLITGLIDYYYDRLYYKHRHWMPDVEIDVEEYAAAEGLLLRFWQEQTGIGG